MRKTLTNAIAKATTSSSGRTVYLHDAQIQGFCLAVSRGGAKSWYWYGRVNGQPRRVRLGSFPEMTATAARQAAREKIGDVARGKDIVAARRYGRRILGELFDFYLEGHAKLKKRTWERDQREYDR